MHEAKRGHNMDCAALYKFLVILTYLLEIMLHDWNIMLSTQANFDWTMTHSIP